MGVVVGGMGAGTPVGRRRPRGSGTVRVLALGVVLAVAATLTGISASAQEKLGAADFAVYVNSLRPKAAAAGISGATFDKAFAGIQPDDTILPLLDQQPELEHAIWDYLDKIVSPERIERGKQVLLQFSGIFDAIETFTGVDRKIVAAIWGIESTFGDNSGTRNVVRSLATLGWKGGRMASYGETQLLAALRILQHGDVKPEAMTGSWAGAMGYTQFIPTTFNAYAIDFDKDGRRDIWTTPGDALASTANYLSRSGWKADLPWGYEVTLPQDFDYTLSGLGTQLSLGEWSRLGIMRIDRSPLALRTVKASLLLPAGARGPAFLVTANFRAILRYNNATAYGLAVATLADRFAGLPPVLTPWPRGERPLQREEREELQRLLAARGFALGEPDGVIGTRTRKAVMSYQAAHGIPADGFPTVQLLEFLRREDRS